ncbi:hypothetical protein K438DRAFT_1641960, partial [Mycena galopus ATCC 62051]
CGALGVMKVPDVLPEGVNPTDIRKCAGHPVEINGTRANHDGFQGLVGCACVTSAQFGCSEFNGVGYCWNVCGTGGEWCWTANNGGFGGWDMCISVNHCGTDNNAYRCGASGCARCDCSC